MKDMEENNFSFIGKKVPKIDALEKVTGAGLYGHDIKLPGMLYGKILRSAHPHAKIVKIEEHDISNDDVFLPALFMEGFSCVGMMFLQSCLLKLDGPNRTATISF